VWISTAQGYAPLVDGLELRTPRRDEAAAIAELLNAHSLALTGRPGVTADEVAYWFDEPGLQSERDMCIVVTADGELAAYADLGGGGERDSAVWIDLRVRPGREAVVTPLLARMERNAVARGAPPRPLRAPVLVDDVTVGEMLGASGYGIARSGYRMELDLDVPPPPPTWPAGLAPRPLEPGEERRVYDAYAEAFGDSPDSVSPYAEWRFWLLEDETNPALVFVVHDRDEIAGLSVLRERRGADLELGWIHVIGVRSPWRGRGLGRALLLHAFQELRARGKRRAGLGVNGDNGAAIALYESVGMRVSRRSDVWEKRP
jgi:mycothiol synthase